MSEGLILLHWVKRLSRLKEEWSCSWRFWMFRGSEVPCIPLSISLLECLPAGPHLVIDESSKPVCLFTTWLRKELSSAKITLPGFSFKLRIDQRRKLKHFKAENICSEKVHSVFSCLSAMPTDRRFSDKIQQWMDESIEKRFLPNLSCFSHGVSKIPSFS